MNDKTQSGGRRNRASATREPDTRSEKLHKMLATAGLGSRRDMEEFIASGRVSVNGLPVQVGDRVKPSDVIRMNGRIVHLPWGRTRPRVLLYHKLEGEIVSRDDPQGRPSVFEKLPRTRGSKWISVGRLDFNTEGLLIFTTGGELANRLAHPRYEVEREYAVRILGEIQESQMEQLLDGVPLEDGPAQMESVVPKGGEGVNHWYHMVIKEGRNREVRRIMEALGLIVSRLIRVRFGPLDMPPRLKRGMHIELTEEEVDRLMDWCGLRPEGSSDARGKGKAADRTGRPPRPQASPPGRPQASPPGSAPGKRRTPRNRPPRKGGPGSA